MKALVIDDDEISRELLCSELREHGIEVYELPSPIGATRMIQAHDVDAVIVDIVMPAMRGDRLAALLRGNSRFARLSVILVSGNADVELKTLAATVGADGVISKANLRGRLAKLVKNVVRTRSTGEAV